LIVGARAIPFLAVLFCEVKNEIQRQKSEDGQKFLPSPISFLFARPSENYQNPVSGFSLKKSSDFVQDT
jgi:hypothetical protein